MLGGLRARAGSVPGTTLLTSGDFQYRLTVSEATVVITGEENAAKVDSAGAVTGGRATRR